MKAVRPSGRSMLPVFVDRVKVGPLLQMIPTWGGALPAAAGPAPVDGSSNPAARTAASHLRCRQRVV